MVYAAALLPAYYPGRAVKRACQLVAGAVGLQVLAGVTNIFLSAPGQMQVVHLLFANLAWISLILLAATLRMSEPAH